jgi:hypothetical protein
MAATDPNWLLEGLRLAVPVVLRLSVLTIQTLAQRAWNKYEHKRDIYLHVVRLIDSYLPAVTSLNG